MRTCWAFATTAALESYLLISQNHQYDLSEQILVSCGGAGDCSGGFIDLASDYVRDTGLPPQECDPYTAENGTCPALSTWQPFVQKSGGWQWVTTDSATVDALKSALATYGPLITTMEVYSDFMYFTTGIYHYTSGSLVGGHAVLLVGYDDNSEGAFIVKNSWGSGWGESGYFRIAYSEISSEVFFGQYTIANINATPACTFSLSPASTSATGAGGSDSVNVAASAPTCAWTAKSNTSWITINSGTSGTGSGTVSYTVAANTGQDRSGTITIAGNTFTLNQAVAPIPTISVSPTSIRFGSVRVRSTSTRSVTISNKVMGTLNIYSLDITGSSRSSFGQTNNCGYLGPNTTCTARVTFKPSSRGWKSASLTISSNDPSHPTTNLSLSGTGN